jgi:TM2 domain-containing membrane protein YozV
LEPKLNGKSDRPVHVPQTPRHKIPLLAALLSALVCGLGQVYNGRVVRGIVLFLLTYLIGGIGGVLGSLTFGLGMIPFAVVVFCLWVYGIFNAWADCRRNNRFWLASR